MIPTLQLRPPRRHPRVLGLGSHRASLVVVSLDPWENRGLWRFRLRGGLKSKVEMDKELEAVLLRERPKALAVRAGCSRTTSVARSLATRFHLPLLVVSATKIQTDVLPASHRLPKDASRLARQTVAVGYAALFIILQQTYDSYSKQPTSKRSGASRL